MQNGQENLLLICYLLELTFEKLQDYSLQSTSGLKTPLQTLSWKSSERKRYSKISKILTKSSQNYPFISQVTVLSPGFLT